MVLTQTQIANLQVSMNGRLTDEQILKKFIDEDMQSSHKAEMEAGERYYRVDNEIIDEDFRKWWEYDENGNKIRQHIQDDKANNKIPHGFFRLQVLEKVSYLLKNPITITYGENNETEAEKKSSELVRDRFMDVLGEEFNDIIPDYVTGAANKGREWLYVYFENFEFKYMIIDAREVIPIWDTSRQNMLESLIRYYPVTVNEAGEEKERLRVEWYFKDRVEVYQEGKNGEFVLEEVKGHFTRTDTADGSETMESWGEVPFIEVANNSKRLSDLRFIKALIDAYDRLDSEFANDLEDIQEAIVKAVGVSDKPSVIRRNLRRFKVFVSNNPREETDLDFLSQDVPHEAKIAWMQKAEKNISIFGMSLDQNADSFGQNPSGVALNWMYLPLDLKTSLLEKKLKSALYKLFWFVNEYFRLSGKEKPVEDVKQFKFTFNKNMIANNREHVELSNQSVGKISERTRLENDPRVDDVDDELRRMEEDRKNGVGGAEEIGKIPLAIQQLALAKQRAIDTGQTAEADKLAKTIDGLLMKVSGNGVV